MEVLLEMKIRKKYNFIQVRFNRVNKHNQTAHQENLLCFEASVKT